MTLVQSMRRRRQNRHSKLDLESGVFNWSTAQRRARINDAGLQLINGVVLRRRRPVDSTGECHARINARRFLLAHALIKNLTHVVLEEVQQLYRCFVPKQAVIF